MMGNFTLRSMEAFISESASSLVARLKRYSLMRASSVVLRLALSSCNFQGKLQGGAS